MHYSRLVAITLYYRVFHLILFIFDTKFTHTRSTQFMFEENSHLRGRFYFPLVQLLLPPLCSSYTIKHLSKSCVAISFSSLLSFWIIECSDKIQVCRLSWTITYSSNCRYLRIQDAMHMKIDRRLSIA